MTFSRWTMKGFVISLLTVIFQIVITQLTLGLSGLLYKGMDWPVLLQKGSVEYIFIYSQCHINQNKLYKRVPNGFTMNLQVTIVHVLFLMMNTFNKSMCCQKHSFEASKVVDTI